MIEIYHPKSVAWGEDTDTLPAPRVYDIFRSANDKKVVVLFVTPRGTVHTPPRLKIFCRGEPLRYEKTDLNPINLPWSLDLLEAPMPPGLASREDSLPVELTWGEREYKTEVSPNPFLYLENPVCMTLMTMQKDHPFDQIKDWCLYYHRVHKVPHVVLYDNGSGNLDDLVRELDGLAPQIRIKIIDWDVPFRVKIPNGFIAQLAALNHCYYSLGLNSRYYLNFDLDEYLINPSKMPLLEYLESQKSGPILDLRIPGYWIPAVYTDGFSPGGNASNRVFHFPYRKKTPKKCNTKTIFGYCDNFYTRITVHENFPAEDSPRKTQQNSILKFVRKMLRKIHRPLRVLLSMKAAKGVPVKQNEESKYKTLYFNHYCGLTTGWIPDSHTIRLLRRRKSFHSLRGGTQSRKDRLLPVEYDPAIHEYDEEMARLLKEADLASGISQKD